MGSLILCHNRKAGRPYEITHIRRRLYTLEELCHYLCNHLYLIDETVVNKELCDWIETELELKALADELRKTLSQHGSMEQFVLTILAESTIYTADEWKKMKQLLETLKHQKPIERQKYKADNLLESGAWKAAILVYQSITRGEVDETVDKQFYGRVYACLGAAYGRMFLYREAAKMYETAYQICEDKQLLKAYLYACYRYLSEDEYEQMLEKSKEYQVWNDMLQLDLMEAEKAPCQLQPEAKLETWKQNYRRMATGES